MELARLDKAVLDQEALMARWNRAREQTLQRMLRARREADLDRNARLSAYLEVVRGQVRRAVAALAELRRRREQARRELERVMQSRKVLENYRDRLMAEFLAAQEKAEEKVLDDFSTHRFARSEGLP